MCWSVFLIKLQAYRPGIFIKKRLQHRCFFKTFLRTAFFVEHLFVHYTFSKFYVMISFLDVFEYKIDIFHISCTIAHGPCLFRTCFHTKIFSKCKFRKHCNVGSSTILIELLKFRSNSRIALISPSNLL